MSNKVDKLFKEKLEEHSIQPSVQAWEKVEAHLEKKNKIVLWVRIAAALAIMGLLTFAGLNWNTESKTELVKKESGVRGKEQERTPVVEQKGAPEKIKRETKKVQRNVIVTPVVEEPAEQIAVVPEREVIPAPEVESQPENLDSKPELASKPETKKGITLTYSLPPVKKQEAPAEPVVAKKTGFGRMIEIAKEVKNSDNPLGELRQAKDEIFALDFRKEKDKKKQ